MRVALFHYKRLFSLPRDYRCKIQERGIQEGQVWILSISHYVSSSKIATCTLCKLRRGRARGSEQNGYVNISYVL